MIMTFDVLTVRRDFPVLSRLVNNKPLVYLDSANTSQKPNVVIDALSHFMAQGYAPVNRSSYKLAAEATDLFEGTRTALARFINAPKAHEVIFTRNATEALNLVIMSWGRAHMKAGDFVLLTHMEHHANIVPWHMLVAELGIKLRWVPLTIDGQLDLSNIEALLQDVKVFSFTSTSNVLGTINPVQELCAAAHKAGALAIVDGCQSVPHQLTDVQAWGADFVAFSSHKMCGPSGVGVLWGREELLEVRLDDGRVLGLAEDLEQVVVADEVEAREGLALLLEEVGERLLAALELVEDGLQRLGELRRAQQRKDALVVADAEHDRSELLIDAREARLLVRQRAAPEDGLQVHPLALDRVELREHVVEEHELALVLHDRVGIGTEKGRRLERDEERLELAHLRREVFPVADEGSCTGPPPRA